MGQLYNIYLAGFMGTGKSSVGKSLARVLKWGFVDLDELIAQGEKRSINDIFSQSGEGYFRKLEKQALDKTVKKHKQVVACGGGIVIDPDNIRVMKETGKLIVLSARPEIILKRTKGNVRPLLNVPAPQARILELLEARKSYYSQADYQIDTSDLAVKEVVKEIISLVG